MLSIAAHQVLVDPSSLHASRCSSYRFGFQASFTPSNVTLGETKKESKSIKRCLCVGKEKREYLQLVVAR